MNTRLQQFLAAENISQAQFADSLNVARAGISHILAGRNKPRYDFLISLLNRYPRLNLEWLMFGKGKMYKEDPEISPIYTPAPAQDSLFSDYDIKEEENTISLIESNEEDKPIQHIEKQRNVKKIIILFDDGSFQEM